MVVKLLMIYWYIVFQETHAAAPKNQFYVSLFGNNRLGSQQW